MMWKSSGPAHVRPTNARLRRPSKLPIQTARTYRSKTAIDHASRPYGQSVWRDKPAGVIGVSVGALGTAMAQQHLRNVLAYLDMPTLGQPEAFIQAKEGLFESDGQIGAASRQFLQGWIDRYLAWVKRHTA